MKEGYGAALERGVVETIESGGYRVASMTRRGIRTPVIKSLETGLKVGDRVYFFLFPDGDGVILAKMGTLGG